MKFLAQLKQRGKVQVRASAESSLPASAAVPDSGFNFVKNSQGASAAVAELSRSLDTALDQIELDGDLSDQLKFELGRLDEAASGYANSCLSEEFTQTPWNCSSQDAQLISLAWKCAAATHEDEEVEATEGVTVEVLKYIKPSVGGTVKAALVALLEQLPESASRNPHLPILVVAVRGSKSTVDFMVNANSKSEDVSSLFDVNDLLPPTDPSCSVNAHAGFLNCAIALVKYIDTVIGKREVNHILFTGHSAGGAVASLLFLKYLADAKRKASNQKFSCITFGAPPVFQPSLNHILEQGELSALNLGVTLAIVNEYDLVSRADQSYIRSLVDLYRSLFQLGPVADDESVKAMASTTSDSETSTSQKSRTWSLPKPEFWLLGQIVMWRIEAVEVKANDAGAAPTVTMQKLLRLFTIEQEEFARLVFCRVPVHRRIEYEKRVRMLLDGQVSG